MDLHTPQIYRQSNFKKPAILHTSGLKIRDFYALASLIITGLVTFNSGIIIIKGNLICHAKILFTHTAYSKTLAGKIFK